MNFGKMFSGINKSKTEVKKVFTEADLQTAGEAYKTAEAELNALDFGAEQFNEQDSQQKVNAFHEAGKNYDTIHRALHPEKYTEEKEGETLISYAPSSGLTDTAKALNMGGIVADLGTSKDTPLKPKN